MADDDHHLDPLQRPDVQALLARCDSPWGYKAFKRQVENAGNCAHPIRLAGRVDTYDAESGEKLESFDSRQLPDGVLLKACGNRRSSRCQPCSYVYKEDARHLVRAGLLGGKGVPESVAHNVTLMVTLTGPSFGAVHSAGKHGPRACRPGRPKRRCPHGRPLACFARHERDDALVGEALCPSCYQSERHVIWNALSSELWRRTHIYTFRYLAKLVGMKPAELKGMVRLEHLRVAEFQERGVVHLHVLVRADGPEGPGSAAPAWLSADLLSLAVRQAVAAVSVPFPTKLGERIAPRARWGEMLDISAITDDDGSARAARYCGKYLQKATDEGGVLDHCIRAGEIATLRGRGLSEHQCRLVETAWKLGGRAELEHLHLRHWAHQLGYRGHCIAKSRRYSTTLTALRKARAEYQAGRGRNGQLAESVIKVATWEWSGSGYLTSGDALLAARWAEEATEARRAFWEARDIEASERQQFGSI